MKKYFILTALAVVALGACTKIETNEPVVNVDEPIAFGAYTGKTITKAGAYGELTNTLLQDGFGVFAYQTTGDAAIATPNFMYNEKVYGDPFAYDIIKYWPNQVQNGDTDSQDPKAQAAQADKVSFFAYAPYVPVTVGTGVPTGTDATVEGIIQLTGNGVSGDPKVTYKVSNDLNKQVDLCWGVAYANSDNATENWPTVAGTNVSLKPGLPFLGLQKPAINTPIHFYFRHALAQINLSAIAAYNQLAAGGTAQDDVKITIEKVELSVPGMTDKKVLNLNNTDKNTPKWEDAEGATTNNTLSLTVESAYIKEALRYQGAKVQTNTGVVGSTPAAPVLVDNKYFTVIPTTASTKINVKVTYYVTTPDAALATGYSQVKNVIAHDVTFENGLVAGTKNTIKMILGISEVKFEAEVSAWVDGDEREVNLPKN